MIEFYLLLPFCFEGLFYYRYPCCTLSKPVACMVLWCWVFKRAPWRVVVAVALALLCGGRVVLLVVDTSAWELLCAAPGTICANVGERAGTAHECHRLCRLGILFACFLPRQRVHSCGVA